MLLQLLQEFFGGEVEIVQNSAEKSTFQVLSGMNRYGHPFLGERVFVSGVASFLVGEDETVFLKDADEVLGFDCGKSFGHLITR